GLKTIPAFTLAEKGTDFSFPCPHAFTSDARSALSCLLYRFCGNPCQNMTLIGITGTNGKTSTAFILYHLLRQSGLSVGYIGTTGAFCPGINTDTGTMTTPEPRELYPLLARFRDAGVTHTVMEVSSHALAEKRVAPLHFSLGLFTNLSEEHLDYHSTMEEYFSVKKQLFAIADEAIVNADDSFGERLKNEAACPVTSCGIIYPAENTLTDLYEDGENGSHYTYQEKALSFPVFLPLFGTFQLYNSLLAITAARKIGVSPETIRNSLQTVPAIPGRLEKCDTASYHSPISVFIDYAHTPLAMENCLKTVRRRAKGRVVCVFGAGGDRDRGKRKEMGKIASRYADFSYLTSDNARSEAPEAILEDIVKGFTNQRYRVIPDRKTAIETALSDLKENDILLLLGKGHETYQIDRTGTHYFSEKEIVTDFLKRSLA
ncbi:MAG: UDP-N-acetylmuramoyl-L-alanyl-D-glutamate--2,6-diaminopimelate ligase, partial [Clostridia bacterium]|nr:UDP-N-acetylmuramoyl-L-alanyl-D-glutamate--2,6-diaminopimelate ligase [Clostridia bacterium]